MDRAVELLKERMTCLREFEKKVSTFSASQDDINTPQSQSFLAMPFASLAAKLRRSEKARCLQEERLLEAIFSFNSAPTSQELRSFHENSRLLMSFLLPTYLPLQQSYNSHQSNQQFNDQQFQLQQQHNHHLQQKSEDQSQLYIDIANEYIAFHTYLRNNLKAQQIQLFLNATSTNISKQNNFQFLCMLYKGLVEFSKSAFSTNLSAYSAEPATAASIAAAGATMPSQTVTAATSQSQKNFTVYPKEQQPQHLPHHQLIAIAPPVLQISHRQKEPLAKAAPPQIDGSQCLNDRPLQQAIQNTIATSSFLSNPQKHQIPTSSASPIPQIHESTTTQRPEYSSTSKKQPELRLNISLETNSKKFLGLPRRYINSSRDFFSQYENSLAQLPISGSPETCLSSAINSSHITALTASKRSFFRSLKEAMDDSLEFIICKRNEQQAVFQLKQLIQRNIPIARTIETHRILTQSALNFQSDSKFRSSSTSIPPQLSQQNATQSSIIIAPKKMQKQLRASSFDSKTSIEQTYLKAPLRKPSSKSDRKHIQQQLLQQQSQPKIELDLQTSSQQLQQIPSKSASSPSKLSPIKPQTSPTKDCYDFYANHLQSIEEEEVDQRCTSQPYPSNRNYPFLRRRNIHAKKQSTPAVITTSQHQNQKNPIDSINSNLQQNQLKFSQYQIASKALLNPAAAAAAAAAVATTTAESAISRDPQSTQFLMSPPRVTVQAVLNMSTQCQQYLDQQILPEKSINTANNQSNYIPFMNENSIERVGGDQSVFISKPELFNSELISSNLTSNNRMLNSLTKMRYLLPSEAIDFTGPLKILEHKFQVADNQAGNRLTAFQQQQQSRNIDGNTSSNSSINYISDNLLEATRIGERLATKSKEKALGNHLSSQIHTQDTSSNTECTKGSRERDNNSIKNRSITPYDPSDTISTIAQDNSVNYQTLSKRKTSIDLPPLSKYQQESLLNPRIQSGYLIESIHNRGESSSSSFQCLNDGLLTRGRLGTTPSIQIAAANSTYSAAAVSGALTTTLTAEEEQNIRILSLMNDPPRNRKNHRRRSGTINNKSHVVSDTSDKENSFSLSGSENKRFDNQFIQQMGLTARIDTYFKQNLAVIKESNSRHQQQQNLKNIICSITSSGNLNNFNCANILQSNLTSINSDEKVLKKRIKSTQSQSLSPYSSQEERLKKLVDRKMIPQNNKEAQAANLDKQQHNGTFIKVMKKKILLPIINK